MHRSKPSDQRLHQAGFSTLLLILIISLILEIMLFSMFLVSRASLNRTLSQQFSQEAFFAAEGSMNDTLQLLESGQWPPSLPYTQQYTLGEVKIVRAITFNQAANTYSIKIDSAYRQARRSLEAQYQREESEQLPPLNVVLALDISQSMGTASESLKTGVLRLLNADVFTPQDQVGLVLFNHAAVIEQPLTSNLALVKTKVQNRVRSTGGTDHSEALVAATKVLDDNTRIGTQVNPQNIVILFSDGNPNASLNAGSCTDNACYAQTSTGYQPDNRGTACSDEAITIANATKSQKEYIFITIYYKSLTNGGACKDNARMDMLGRRNMQSIASDQNDYYFEAETTQDLNTVFEKIGLNIVKPARFRFEYEEVVPEGKLSP